MEARWACDERGIDNQAGDGDGVANNVRFATVSGGASNTASGEKSTVSGGASNTARGESSTVSGGVSNTASGEAAIVAGGTNNAAGGDFSFAAGSRAGALHGGTFVWADSTPGVFQSSGPDQFLIRASGGVGIGEASPTTPHISGTSRPGCILLLNELA